MHAPTLNPENFDDIEGIYQYYGEMEPHHRVIHAIQKATGVVYRPHVHYAEGAEDEIAERTREGDRFVIASNHFTIADQFLLSALIEKVRVLRGLDGRTFGLSKPSYFTHRVLRPALDTSGILPVFRRQDLPSIRLQAEATRLLTRVAADRMKLGWSMWAFPEGTRNLGDPEVLGKIHGGVGRIASQASEEVGVSILPTALWYPQDEKHHRLRPDHHYFSPEVLIGNPIVGPFPTKLDATIPLRSALQTYVTQVAEHDY